MTDFLANLQADLEDLHRRLDVLEKRFGIFREPQPPLWVESVFSKPESRSESAEERAERRHQEFLAAVQRHLDRSWCQVTDQWEVKQSVPKRWLQ